MPIRRWRAPSKALGAGSPVTELEELLVEQAPDADNAFVMTTPEVLKIISYSGEVADCGEVSLRRLSMRIDLLNKAEGLTITKVTFRNRAVKSRLFTPNAMLAEPGAVEDKGVPGSEPRGQLRRADRIQIEDLRLREPEPPRRGDRADARHRVHLPRPAPTPIRSSSSTGTTPRAGAAGSQTQLPLPYHGGPEGRARIRHRSGGLDEREVVQRR